MVQDGNEEKKKRRKKKFSFLDSCAKLFSEPQFFFFFFFFFSLFPFNSIVPRQLADYSGVLPHKITSINDVYLYADFNTKKKKKNEKESVTDNKSKEGKGMTIRERGKRNYKK